MQIVNPLDISSWDDQIARFPGAGIFHTAAWARVLAESYGYTPTYFVAFHKGELSAVVPMMDVKSWLTGRRGVSLPFTDYVSPLALDDSNLPPLFDQIITHGEKAGWKYVEIRAAGARCKVQGASGKVEDKSLKVKGEDDQSASQPVSESPNQPISQSASQLFSYSASQPVSYSANQPFSQSAGQPLVSFSSFLSHTLDLSPGYGPVSKTFRDSTRRNMKKAAKEGVTVEMREDGEALSDFCELNLLTRRDHGLPPQPDAFFGKLHEHIISRGMGMVAIARHQEKPMAANVYFHFGNKAVYKYGASDDRYQQLRANNLLMGEAIRWYAERGFDTLSMGRTDLHHEGLRQFKTGWGTTEDLVSYFRYDVKKKSSCPAIRPATLHTQPSSAAFPSRSFASSGLLPTGTWGKPLPLTGFTEHTEKDAIIFAMNRRDHHSWHGTYRVCGKTSQKNG